MGVFLMDVRQFKHYKKKTANTFCEQCALNLSQNEFIFKYGLISSFYVA